MTNVHHRPLYAAVVSVAINVVPPRKNCTRAMPDAAAPPVPASAAVALIVTNAPRANEALFAGAVIVTVGAAASMRIACDFSAAWLPATSLAMNLTVVVRFTVNGAV